MGRGSSKAGGGGANKGQANNTQMKLLIDTLNEFSGNYQASSTLTDIKTVLHTSANVGDKIELRAPNGTAVMTFTKVKTNAWTDGVTHNNNPFMSVGGLETLSTGEAAKAIAWATTNVKGTSAQNKTKWVYIPTT